MGANTHLLVACMSPYPTVAKVTVMKYREAM